MGPWLLTSGYVLAIVGGVILFTNTAPDDGGENVLMLPKTPDGPSNANMAREWATILSRRNWNRVGFALLTLGGLLQLAGYWADRLAASAAGNG